MLIMDNNWTIKQTKELFELVGKAKAGDRGLIWAFEQMSGKTNKSTNSVRNYYYSQLKMFELVPKIADDLGIKLINTQREAFETFSEVEISQLVENILTMRANNKSVRQIISDITCGNTKLALRLQNKYRSMITHHKDKVVKIMNDMSKRKVVYYNPFSKVVVDGSEVNNTEVLNDYMANLNEADIAKFFGIMKRIFDSEKII